MDTVLGGGRTPARRWWTCLLLAAVLVGLLLPRPARAQGHPQWVEVRMALDADGRASITYHARWRTNGTMHGFYFEGERATPEWKGGSAQLPGRREVPLAIPARAGR